MSFLSVVIPVKNGMPFLKDSVESVLRENIINLELIVSDDHSTDGSWEYLNSLSDSRIKAIRTEKVLPVDEHWNFVTSFASGEFTKLLCQDDLITEGGLARQLNALTLNPGVNLVASKRDIIDSRGKNLIQSHGLAGLEGVFPGLLVLKKSFLNGTNLLGEPSALMFRTKALKNFLPWDATDPYMLDMELYSRLLPGTSVILLPTTDSCFRVHTKSLSSIHRKSHYKQFVRLYKTLERKQIIRLNLFELIQFKFLTALKTLARSVIFIFVIFKTTRD